jgi:hypothetical protein
MQTKKTLHQAVINNTEATESRIKKVLTVYTTQSRALKAKLQEIKKEILQIRKK